LAGHLSRRPLARPPRPARHRLLDAAAPQARRLPLELALPHVLLLADLLLARLSPSLRVLRDPDLLRPDLPDASGGRRHRRRPPHRRPGGAPPPPARRQSDRAARGRQGALPPAH